MSENYNGLCQNIKIIGADNSKRVICSLFLIESTCVAIKNVTNL